MLNRVIGYLLFLDLGLLFLWVILGYNSSVEHSKFLASERFLYDSVRRRIAFLDYRLTVQDSLLKARHKGFFCWYYSRL